MIVKAEHTHTAQTTSAAPGEVYHLERVAAFDQSVSYALNPVAARVQASSTTDFWSARAGSAEAARQLVLPLDHSDFFDDAHPY